MKEDYYQSIKNLVKDYPNEEFEQGLSTKEAHERLLRNGPNKLETKRFLSGGYLSDNFII